MDRITSVGEVSIRGDRVAVTASNRLKNNGTYLIVC